MKHENGMGERQAKQMFSSRRTIAEFLCDGKPHQFNEIKNASKLSAPTTSKRLKELIKMDLVTKEIDTKSGRYPYPVFYTATDVLIDAQRAHLIFNAYSATIDKSMDRDKNPFTLLYALNGHAEVIFEKMFYDFKKNRNLTKEDFSFYWNMWVLEPYKELTLKLIEKSMKVIDEIDIEKCQKIKYETIQNSISKYLRRSTE